MRGGCEAIVYELAMAFTVRSLVGFVIDLGGSADGVAVDNGV